MAELRTRKKGSPGRPALPESKKRYVTIRITEDDYSRLRAAAGDYSPATWARVALLRAIREATGERGKK